MTGRARGTLAALIAGVRPSGHWRSVVLAMLLVSSCGVEAQVKGQSPPASKPPTAAPPPAAKPPEEWDPGALEDWLRENLDDEVLALLGDVDFRRVQQVFTEVMKKLDANDIYDLATLRDAVVRVLPVLKQFEETEPYAAWLEAQLENVEVADTLRKTVKVIPSEPGTPPVRPPPTPEAQRLAWERRLAPRPWPPTAERLVPRLKPIFRSVGVPAELIWLAEVESSFNPRARSPKGAAGLFQLMPATARSLGLSTWPLDDRLDVDDNARAAAKYLRYLYGRFGEWRLALAAYNAGEGRVGELLASARVKSFVGIAPKLPAETQLYVPRIEATLRKREGVALGRIGAPR